MSKYGFDEVDRIVLLESENSCILQNVLEMDEKKHISACISNGHHKRVHPVGPIYSIPPENDITHFSTALVDEDKLLIEESSFEHVSLHSDSFQTSGDSVCDDPPAVNISETCAFKDIVGSQLLLNLPGISLNYRLPVLMMNLSFCGAGFLGIYHLGVAKALATHGARFMLNVQNFSGASAGILVAAVLAIKGPDLESIDKCTEFTFNLAKQSKKKSLGVLTPRYSLLKPLETFLEELCQEDGHVIAQGRLHVSLTRLRGRKNIVVSSFSDKEHLIKCLLASSYIPFVTGTKIYTINGEKYIDGGLTDNLPRLPHGRTVTVSPFSGKEDICPRDSKWKGLRAKYTEIGNLSVQLSPDNAKRGIHAFFPPNAECMETYYERGFQYACAFLRREGFYSHKQS